MDSGATVIVIEHDLDVIRNGDFVIDMGPGGGEAGGQISRRGHTGRNKEKPAAASQADIYNKLSFRGFYPLFSL